jgi:dTDP-4-amino-4,6-dideoxygalactose transaminase
MFKVHIDSEIATNNLKNVLKSGFFNEGAQVTEFSKKLSEKMGYENIVMTNSCTSSLTMALKLSNVNSGDEVITTSMTCLATNTPIINLGAKIVWADIDPKTGNISPEKVLEKINSKTKAVMCVNWAGLPCDLEKLQKICKDNNVKLIQDAAHGFGSLYNQKDVSHYADFTCFSFQAIKHITTGDGGAIICKSNEDFERAKKMKWFGLDREASKDKNGEWKGQRWKDDVAEAGYKFNMNNLAAAIGLSQIEHIDNILLKHRQNAKQFSEIFKDRKDIIPLKYPSNSNPSFWVYTVLLSENIDRDSVLMKMNKLGIGAGLVHIPNHPYTCFKESFETLEGVEYFHKHQISLPCGWWINEESIKEISDALIEAVNDNQK